MEISLLKSLSELHSVTGDTGRATKFVQGYLEKMKIKSRLNGFGVLLAGNLNKPKIVLSAHIDEVGFRVIKRNQDDTFLVKSSGLVTPELLNNSPVYVQSKNGPVEGFIYAKRKLGDNKPENFGEVFLDVLEPNKVSTGDFGSYKRMFSNSPEKIIATGLDNKIGVYLLLEFIKNNKAFLKSNAIAFVTEEETTYDCIAGMANELLPEYVIVVDMIPVHQQQEATNIMPEIGKGAAVLQSMYKYHLHENVRIILKKIKVPYQEVFAEIDFSPEPQATQKNGITKGFNVMVPMLGWHNGCYSMLIKDVGATLKFIEEFIKQI